MESEINRGDGTGGGELGNPSAAAGEDTLSETAGSEVSQTFTSFVAEASQIKELISSLTSVEQNARRVCVIIDKYQEQPQLLDPHLESMIQPLVEHLRDGASLTSPQLFSVCSILYIIAKVRGFKTVIKFFPHNVSDLEPCLALLSAQDAADHEKWEIRYILLLWLAILVIIPFSLDTVDSSNKAAAPGQTANDESVGLIDRIVNVCKTCLSEASKTRDAAAYVLAQLLTRPDMEDSTLVVFLHWSMEQLSSSSSNQFLITGVQSALAHIFKHGARQSMLDKIPIVVGILHEDASATRTSLQRLYTCKLAQRLGLTYLPARVATWRYNRGHRSLLDNLRGKAPGAAAATIEPSEDGGEDEEDDSFVPVEIDYVVDLLLKALQDRDTVVRWSAAKGIGRITARLPRHLGDEVVSAVMDCFASDAPQVNSWHGGCLALAELARRGLLLPGRLQAVVPVTVKALQMDVRLGSASVGAHVRDAACYVCWAFARAYAPAVMAPYVPVMAPGLLTLALLDREVNCRRAACAAFQENVGRQGSFPHGIELVTKVDYFSVGSRSHAFLTLAPLVAERPEYRAALLEHLVRRQLRHWDVAMRRVASEALRKVAALDVDATLGDQGVLAQLLTAALSPDLPTRHGATLGVAEVVLGLRDGGTWVGERWNGEVAGLVPAIEKARLFRGRGGEVMRGACCRVLEAMAEGGVKLGPKEVQKLVEGCGDHLKHPTEAISKAAAGAVGAMSRACFGEVSGEWRRQLVLKYGQTAEQDANPAARRGFALGLGALGRSSLVEALAEAVSALVRAATVLDENPEERDAAARRNAVQGLMAVVSTVGIRSKEGDGGGLTAEMVLEVVEGLLRAAEDYCVDNRGDVGSWVRMAAMEGMAEVCVLACKADADAGVLGKEGGVWVESYSRRIVQALVKQLSEKIDGVRACAGTVLHQLLFRPSSAGSPSATPPPDGDAESTPATTTPAQADGIQVPFVPDREALESAIGGDGLVDWRAPAAAFPRVATLLRSPDLMAPALAGFVVSVGGISESTVKHSWGSLLQSLQGDDGAALMIKVGSAMLELLEENKGVDRVVVPAMRTIHLLITNGCMDAMPPSSSPVPKGILERVQGEMRGCKDVGKLQAGVSVAAALLQYDDASLRVPALQTLLAMLTHRYPRVRKQAGEEMYLQVLTHEGLVGEDYMEQATAILGETDWTADVPVLRPARDELYPAFGVTRAESTAPTSAVPRAPRPLAEEQGSAYKDLVKEMHY